MMTQQEGAPGEPLTPANDAMLKWWNQQWLQGSLPMARIQLAWMESLADAMQFEAQCLHALAESGERITSGYGTDPTKHPHELHERYHQLIRDVTHTHLQRLGKVAELSEDFRKRIWEEL
ncbi:hypothetical protein ACGTN6_16450 [Halomonas sp. THAF12]|uniref:hypothetical protein n=1 Tax=Halomonas sp. B23F22_10 TaxID=3459515 RepID=UPI00373F5CD9